MPISGKSVKRESALGLIEWCCMEEEVDKGPAGWFGVQIIQSNVLVRLQRGLNRRFNSSSRIAFALPIGAHRLALRSLCSRAFSFRHNVQINSFHR